MMRLLLLPALAALAQAGSFLRAGQVSEADVVRSIEAELAAMGGQRIAQLEDSLRPIFNVLPKNANGRVGHQAARYVLHRVFVQRYGWFIRGLEPNNETWHDAENNKVKEWVPSYLQEAVEKRFQDGLDLPGLAAFAAALEDLIRQEAAGRLDMAYDIHGLKKDSVLTDAQVKDVTRSYYVSFLLAGNLSASNLEEINRKKSIFARKYSGWKEAEEWLNNLEETHKPAKTFAGMSDFVSKIGENYFKFNDNECRELKSTLKGMEGFKAGRVRLSNFYKKSLYSHWRFTEKADYLRSLGALDESDPQQPHVLVANYIMARPNCLSSSSLYAVCCRNECEDLMGHIERTVAAPSGTPQHIASIVSQLPSDTVPAQPLSATLTSRLEQVAAVHGGLVPLHGRLFAQWMHHVYPRECPYPHQIGSTSPQTPDEWMHETGAASTASVEEMRKQVESDTCASDAGPGGCTEAEAGGSELPWNEAEELLAVAVKPYTVDDSKFTHTKPTTPATPTTQRNRLDFFALASAGAMAAMIAMDAMAYLSATPSSEVLYVSDPKGNRRLFAGLRMAAICWGTALVAWSMDLLDTGVFGCAMCAGTLLLSIRHIKRRFESPLSCLGKSEKFSN